MHHKHLLLALLLVVVLAACSGGESKPEPASTQAAATATSVPTSTATVTPTSLPTATRTAVPTPTPFITPPAAGQTGIVPILMYHHLADLPKSATQLDLDWTVAPKNFEAQIAWLAEHNYHTITMGQVSAYLARRQPLPTKPLVISFDDGWAEQYSVAWPVLKKYGFIGTLFVYTSVLDHANFLKWAQVEEMAGAGMDIESHTLTHPHLRNLTEDAAKKELADSKALLEKRLGKPVTSLDFPYGEYNDAVIRLVKNAGYESAVTIASGYKQRADELYTLHRIRVSYGDSLEQFSSRMPQLP